VDRLVTFRSFIARSPDDPFPRYGLAMEHKTRGELNEARAAFDELITKFPNYVASYLHAAAVCASLGDREASIDLLQRGIAAAVNDPHARKELEAALASA